MFGKYHSSRILLVILLTALLIRLGAASVWQSKLGPDEKFRFGDSDGYWHLAERIAQGEPYQYGSPYAKVFRAPGYPLLLSTLFLFSDNPSVYTARVLGILLGVVSLWIIWLIGRQLFDVQIALFATLLGALYPGAIAISILVLAEALFVPLMLLQFYAMVRAWKAKSFNQVLRWSLCSGVFNGLAILTRPSWLLFVPWLLVAGIVMFPQRNRQLQFVVFTLLATGLVMAPWWVRNYQVTGHFVLTTLQTGPSLYDGLNPDADGSSNMEFAPDLKRQFLEEYRKSGTGPMKEAEFYFNELMKEKAIDWASQNPSRVFELALIKLFRIWNPWPNSNELNSRTMKWAIALPFLFLILSGLVCIWSRRKNFLVISVTVFPLIYFSLLHMVFIGSIRYRQPPMMTFLLLSAAGIAVFLGMNRRKTDRDVLDPSGSADLDFTE